MPRRKQQVTQEKSKVLKESERDPFEDAADDEDVEAEPSTSRHKSKNSITTNPLQSAFAMRLAGPETSSASKSAFSPKKSKKGKKDDKKKAKPFDLEEEKAKMKSTIAESSVAAINLLNSLQLINREHERVSENAGALQRFENCKLLRRHILRYVSFLYLGTRFLTLELMMALL
jgi:hypothetical protein